MVNKIRDASSPASLRRTHRALVLSRIQIEPGVARSELAQALGFSDMAATRIIRELLAAGLISEMETVPDDASPPRKRLGRPKIGLRIVGSGLFGAGITVSAYYSEVSLCDANGAMVARERLAYLGGEDLAATARRYGDALARLIDRSDVDPARIVGVGVALAARTSPDGRQIVKSDYFGWGADDGLFRREVERLTGLPTQIENIANALAIAEMDFGVARGVSDFALIHAATLIGAASMSGGRLVRGRDGVSGMIGHCRAQPSGLRCVCGRSDCLNLSSTGFGLLSRLGQIADTAFDRTRLEDYAARLLEAVEDDRTTPLIAEMGANLASTLDTLCKLLGPEMVILSGYLGGNAHYIDGLRAAIPAEQGRTMMDPVPIVQGAIPPTQAAALLALKIFGYSPKLDFDRFAREHAAIGLSHGG